MKTGKGRNSEAQDSFKELGGLSGPSRHLEINRWKRGDGILELMLEVNPSWAMSGSRLWPVTFTAMVTPLEKVKELGCWALK